MSAAGGRRPTQTEVKSPTNVSPAWRNPPILGPKPTQTNKDPNRPNPTLSALDRREKVAQRAFLSCHLPHSLAHRVAQLAVEFSSRGPTAAAGLRSPAPLSRREPHRTIVVAMSHQVLTIAMATSHKVPPLTDCCCRTMSPPIVSSTGMIAGRGYAPPIMLHCPPGSWACSIRCTRHNMTIDLGKQLTMHPLIPR